MFRLLLISIFSAVSCFYAFAEEVKVPRLIFKVPSGWEKGYERKTDLLMLNEFVKKGQTVENWKELLTFQAYKNEISFKILDFASTYAGNFRRYCDFYHVDRYVLDKAYENETMMIYCSSSMLNVKSEQTLAQFVKFKNRLFVIQKAWKTKTFNDIKKAPVKKEDVLGWKKFLEDNVRFCYGTKEFCKVNEGEVSVSYE